MFYAMFDWPQSAMKGNRMNAPLPINLIPHNIAPMSTEMDIVGLASSGSMALAAMVSHAEQLQRDGHAQAASNLYALWLAHLSLIHI